MGQKLDENLRKAVTELISGTFYIPQHCACCAGTGNLSDHPLEHSSSSSYTNGNTVTTTTTTNSIKVKICDDCKASVEKEIKKANKTRNLVYLLMATVCFLLIYARAKSDREPIASLVFSVIGGLLGAWIAYAATFGWILPNETKIWEKRLGGLGLASFDFSKLGQGESSLKSVLTPYFASPEYDKLFDAANPSLQYMKSISRVTMKK